MNQDKQQKKIIEAAQILFYDAGYNKTSCSQIGAACDLSEGGVFYHFPTKSSIGIAVYNKYMRQLKNVVARKLYDLSKEYDLQIGTALETVYEINMLLEDAKARRFYCEFHKTNMEYLYTSPLLNFYELHNKKYRLIPDNDNDRLKMIAIESHVASVALNLAYIDGVIKCDRDYFTESAIRIPFEHMKVPQENTDEIIRRTYELLKQIDIKLLPCFTYE